MTAPFLRWAGGKRSLLEQLRPLLPEDIHSLHYVEPFLGGGALFFDVNPDRATLCDVNLDLVTTYKTLRDEPNKTIECLEGLAHGHSSDPFLYQHIRSLFNGKKELTLCAPSYRSAARAAWFIYLNRACFNGLWRVNKAGEFNVPSGRKASIEVNEEGLRACSAALKGANIDHGDFTAFGHLYADRKFFYFDPPYLDTFSDYAKGGFVARDHQRLREHFGHWDRRGHLCMLSHLDTPWIREMYAGYNITAVRCGGNIAARSAARVVRNEVVIRNYA